MSPVLDNVVVILLLVPFLVVRATASKIFNIYLPGWNDECIFPAVALQFVSLMEPLWCAARVCTIYFVCRLIV